MSTSNTFTCYCCGKVYNELPLCFGGQYPDYYFNVPPDERDERVEYSESLCVIDNHFFHRGRITIPIIDYEEDLTFNVWTTISEANFELRNEMWDDSKRIEQQPYFGWLQTLVPTYGNTLSLKTLAHENEVGYIPTIEVTDDHQLQYDQEHGITFQAALDKVQQILKEWHKK
jgi:hypothetical protein